jgi:hypothetical protein
MLRGQQTLGELRERAGRFYEFSDLSEVNDTLDKLMTREAPLVVKLERQAGQKEVRFAHLLSGEVVYAATEYAGASNSSRVAGNERISNLEREVETLKTEIETLRQMFEDFKKQFE